MSDEKNLPPSDVKIIGNFNLGAQLPNGRTISFAGYLYEGEGLASINDRLDLCQESVERQRARCEIPELEAKREQCIKAMEQLREVLVDLEDKRKKTGALSSQENLTLRNHKVNLQKLDAEIEKGDKAILESKRKCGIAA